MGGIHRARRQGGSTHRRARRMRSDKELTGRALGYRALTGLCEEMRLNFERVFDRFSRVVSRTGRRWDGSGVGSVDAPRWKSCPDAFWSRCQWMPALRQGGNSVAFRTTKVSRRGSPDSGHNTPDAAEFPSAKHRSSGREPPERRRQNLPGVLTLVAWNWVFCPLRGTSGSRDT